MSLALTLKSGFNAVKGFLTDNSGLILSIIGDAACVTGFVLAVRAGGKIDREISASNQMIQEFKDLQKNYKSEDENDVYTVEDLKKDIFRTRRRCVINVTKKLLLPAALEIGGLVADNLATASEHKRFKEASAAAVMIAGSFAAYRGNVISELGEEMDQHFMYGTSLKEKNVTLVSKDEDGNEVETKEKMKVFDNIYGASPYAMVWTPETTYRYIEDEYYLRNFASNAEKYLNDTLICSHKYTLNEAKKYFGAKPDQLTLAGQAAGWKEGDVIKITVIAAALPLGDGKYKKGFIIDFNCHYILDAYKDKSFGEDEILDDSITVV